MTSNPDTVRHDGLKLWNGIWLPAGETHLTGWMQKMNQRDAKGRMCYQKHKLDAALSLCTHFRRAIDVGAHCGLWSMHLVDKFQSLEAFEPVELHRRAWWLNVINSRFSAERWSLHACALGEADGMVSMKSAPDSSGDTVVDGAGDIPMRRLDDVLSHCGDVDFIKLDCEGYELHALKGGEQMLKRCRPVICVEQKPGKAQSFGLAQTGAVQYLESLGARVVREISGDFLMKWPS